ncbi:MAG: PQQ-binding-like beta-propeller repeat protein [Chthonomonadaceae bacterium]|nr:PQQ-binding-like beta-propeller repeat protein [Chthonomonadaceae bacterium]
MRRSFALAFLTLLALASFAQYKHDWTRYTDGPTHQTEGSTMADTDPNGNIYTLGTTAVDGSGIGADFIVTKRDKFGTLIWSTGINGDGNSQDIAADLVYKAGFVYICGRVTRPTNWYADSDFYTLKIDSTTGSTQWSRYYSGTFQSGLESSIDGARALAVDNLGNVFVTGFTWEWDYFFSNADYRTIKYSPEGALLWSKRYHGGATYIAISDQAYLIEIGPDGNPVVSGDSPAPNNSSEWATIKYDADSGNEIWVQRSSAANISIRSCVPTALKFAQNGDVFVAGTAFNDATAIIRYHGASGSPLWTWAERVGHIGYEDAFTLSSNDDAIVGVTYDPDADDSNLNNNTRLIRFRGNDGIKLWTRDYGNSVFGNFEGVKAIEALPDGRTIVAGVGPETPYNSRLLLLQYAADGTLEWNYTHTLEKKLFEVRQVWRDPFGALILNSHAAGPSGSTDIATLRFASRKTPKPLPSR